LIDSHQFRSWNPRLPRNLVAKIYSFANRRQKRERDKDEAFSNRAQFHRSAFYAASRRPSRTARNFTGQRSTPPAGDAGGVAVFGAGVLATFGLTADGRPGGVVTTTFR